MKHNSKKILRFSIVAAFFAFIVIYAFFRSKNLIAGVQITGVEMNRKADMTEISGNAQNAVRLTLNGREISMDQAGDFNETIALLSGYNVVSIEAEDKFGKKDEKVYKLINSAPPPAPAPIEVMEEATEDEQIEIHEEEN